MIAKQCEAKYSYDYRSDLVNIEVDKQYNHGMSIYLDVGVYLDLDENYIPVNLEIVDAAGRMGIDKDCLINPDGHVNITITDEIIDVAVIFKFKEDNEYLQLNAVNTSNIPNIETNFALVTN